METAPIGTRPLGALTIVVCGGVWGSGSGSGCGCGEGGTGSGATTGAEFDSGPPTDTGVGGCVGTEAAGMWMLPADRQSFPPETRRQSSVSYLPGAVSFRTAAERSIALDV